MKPRFCKTLSPSQSGLSTLTDGSCPRTPSKDIHIIFHSRTFSWRCWGLNSLHAKNKALFNLAPLCNMEDMNVRLPYTILHHLDQYLSRLLAAFQRLMQTFWAEKWQCPLENSQVSMGSCLTYICPGYRSVQTKPVAASHFSVCTLPHVLLLPESH